VLEYHISYRTTKPQVPGQFWYEHNFTKVYVAKNEELEISVPRDKYVKVESPEYQPNVQNRGSRTVYNWRTSNSTARSAEELLVDGDAAQPSVQFTTFRSWEEVGDWYEKLQRSQVEVTPQIQAKAAELTKGLTGDAKVRAIYNYVSTRFHYISLSFGIGRYQPHAAQDVLENEYGDCKDKHTLLASLLKAAGYDAWPALINSARKIDAAMPSPGQFNHVITVVRNNGVMLWLDTTPEVAPFGLLLSTLRDKDALLIPPTDTKGKPSLVRTPTQPPFQSFQKFVAEGTLAADGTLTAHIQQLLRGDTEVIYRLAIRSLSPQQ
jgi:hypothetical protein